MCLENLFLGHTGFGLSKKELQGGGYVFWGETVPIQYWLEKGLSSVFH